MNNHTSFKLDLYREWLNIIYGTWRVKFTRPEHRAAYMIFKQQIGSVDG